MDANHPGGVLIVDDEPQAVWVLQLTLEAEGVATYSAHDGREALEQIRRHEPAVVLLDAMMPRMDGWHVLEELNEWPLAKRPRVILVTALASPEDRKRAAGLGAAAYVTKPFDADALLALVHDLELAS
jgi:two-component system KDP operon response regulator KdpE